MGDPAHGVTRNILAPFCGVHLTDDQQEFNLQMSKVRASVEWGFEKICQNFALMDFKKKPENSTSAYWKLFFWWQLFSQTATRACMGL